jgi:hypothetical protein
MKVKSVHKRSADGSIGSVRRCGRSRPISGDLRAVGWRRCVLGDCGNRRSGAGLFPDRYVG